MLSPTDYWVISPDLNPVAVELLEGNQVNQQQVKPLKLMIPLRPAARQGKQENTTLEPDN